MPGLDSSFDAMIMIGAHSMARTRAGVLYHTMCLECREFRLNGKPAGEFAIFAFVSISSCASGMSLLGSAGLGYKTGWPTIWEQMLVPLACALSIFLFGTKIYRVSQKKNFVTIQDYLSLRYNSTRSIRTLSSIIVIIVSTIYLSGQYTAISITMGWLFKMPHEYALLLGAVVVMLYVILGGLYAVAWTALFQGVIIIAGVLIVAPFIIGNAGGLTHINENLAKIDPNMLALAYPQAHPPVAPYAFATPLYLVSFAILLGLGLASAPHIVSNSLSAKRYKYFKWAPLAAFAVYVVVFFLIKISGYAARSMVYDKTLTLPNVANAADYSFIAAIQAAMPEFIWPVFAIIVLSAVLTTTDSLMLRIGSSFSWDIYKKYLKPDATDKQINNVNRIVIVVAALGTMLAAIKPPELLAWLIWTGIGIMLSTFVAPILFGLYWRRTTKEGAFWGMLSGLVAALVFGYLAKFVTKFPVDFSLFSFLISVAVLIIVSLCTKPTPENILDETETGFFINKNS